MMISRMPLACLLLTQCRAPVLHTPMRAKSNTAPLILILRQRAISRVASSAIFCRFYAASAKYFNEDLLHQCLQFLMNSA